MRVFTGWFYRGRHERSLPAALRASTSTLAQLTESLRSLTASITEMRNEV